MVWLCRCDCLKVGVEVETFLPSPGCCFGLSLLDLAASSPLLMGGDGGCLWSRGLWACLAAGDGVETFWHSHDLFASLSMTRQPHPRFLGKAGLFMVRVTVSSVYPFPPLFHSSRVGLTPVGPIIAVVSSCRLLSFSEGSRGCLWSLELGAMLLLSLTCLLVVGWGC